MLMPWALDVNPKGVIHVGGNIGEESAYYDQHPSIKRVVWFEGNKCVIPYLRDAVEFKPGNYVINAVVTDVDNGETEFHVTTNGASSSVLPLAKHAIIYPNIKECRVDKVKTRTVDSLLLECKYIPQDFDFVNLDVQGAELLVLKGMTKFLNNIRWVYTEVNFAELYKGCALVSEIDSFLANLGFKEVKTVDTGCDWGDKFYEKS